MMKKKKKRISKSIRRIFPTIIGVVCLFMGIGYAIINSTILMVGGDVLALEQDGVFITQVNLKNNINANIDRSEIKVAQGSVMNSTIVLADGKSDSEITYTVTVYNSSEYDYFYAGEVTYDSDFYDNPNIVFLLSDNAKNGVVIKSGEYFSFDIIFKYKSGVTPSSTINVLNSSLSFDFHRSLIGETVAINGEYFNIIGHTKDSVKLFARYNLGVEYKQSTTENYVAFNGTGGWDYTPGPKEIDIHTWAPHIAAYVDNYVAYLQGFLGINDVSGDLITFTELITLGCNLMSDYSWSNGARTCTTSPYTSWLKNGKRWWSHSASSNYYNSIWSIWEDLGAFDALHGSHGIRPVITVPLDIAYSRILRDYEVGEVVTIENEQFNVISDDGDTITMLAVNNLGTNFRQTAPANYMLFSNNNGWNYTGGPNEIDIQLYDGGVKTYVNEYVSYLKGVTGDVSLSGTLITLKQLKDLGCNISEDYAFKQYDSCSSSKHISWLNNGLYWWTRSVVTDTSTDIWRFVPGNSLGFGTYNNDGACGNVRPVITLTKEALMFQRISFTLDGESYVGEIGMTWEEWISSSYNKNPNIRIVGEDVALNSNAIQSSQGMVKASSALIPGEVYKKSSYEVE